MTEGMIPRDYQERIEPAGDGKLRVISYKLGNVYICAVDNVDPGATLARAEGNTREEVEAKAVGKARAMVLKTRNA